RAHESAVSRAQAAERAAAVHLVPGARFRPVLAGVDPRHAPLRGRHRALARAALLPDDAAAGGRRRPGERHRRKPAHRRRGDPAVALGCPNWTMIVLVTYRAARTGILTGLLLALARISGETAPLLFTALNNQFWSLDLNRPMSNLPTVIFQFAMSPYADWHRLAWGGAALTTPAILCPHFISRLVYSCCG